MELNLNKTIAMSLILFLIYSGSYCNTEDKVKIEIRATKDIYIIGEPINIEVKFKNCIEKEMLLYKYFTPLETFWEIKVFNKDLKELKSIEEDITGEKSYYVYDKEKGINVRVTKLFPMKYGSSGFTPLGGKENYISLKHEEEYKINVDISKDQFISKLKEGKYKIKLVYIGSLILFAKEKDKYDKYSNDIESNEIELKLGDKELQGFLKENPSADLNKDGILTYEEKNKYLESLPKEEKK
jgi:hypothetical protein